MKADSRAQTITRWSAIAFMAAAVLTATAGGFAQSYAGLYHWALEHGLRGWKAESFPLLVDLFIIVGELGLFLLAIDAFVLQRRRLLSWLDFGLPLSIALAGWTASLIFNVGHVGERAFSYQATAAVPPIVSMLGLFVLLRTLHRYVADEEPEPEPKRDSSDIRAVALHQVTLTPIRNTGPLFQVRARPEPALGPGAAAPPQKAAAGTSAPAEPATVPETRAPQPESAPSVNGTGPLNGATAAAEPSPVKVAKPAPATLKEPVLAPSAVMSSTNGAREVAVLPEAAVPQLDPDALRGVVIEALERHHGDVAATLADLTSKGHLCDEAEVRRISANHWFPYAVYRLLARHDGDGETVAGLLAERGVDFDQAALDELVRSWRA
ncbi:DUF2637 domain-containing protein [Actinomadura rudentiformis]|uniref:DUF2637 domain-containing protein n=1 Tax=Actinomadura rudentiformis TaxID=359158 RepID=A0A6H9YRP2_9ACTN|nr:DUF2637 domain-containing protein [Actinomadura rudentiformis]KAB2349420.1 DUF2637 domain-containing protein [Actinomadura rudentiformis]